VQAVFVSPEVFPFAKSGGLADVAGTLPRELGKLGVDVRVFTPYYRATARMGPTPTVRWSGRVRVGEETLRGEVLESRLGESDTPVYFLRSDSLFDREGLYGEDGRDYPDNPTRFVFLSRMVLEALEPLGLRPDVIHVNDWQTALIPVYVRTLYDGGEGAPGPRTLLTIHNLGYQGIFWHWDMNLTGLSWDLFNWRELEFHGQVNFLKGGIVFADRINTVSKTYAREIRTPEFGRGLEGVLGHRAADLSGVVNGIDTGVWDPRTDPHIAARFSADDLSGKARCKEALVREAGIDDGEAPLFGIITRLDWQKGVDLLCDVLRDAVTLGMRLVLLGTGDAAYHRMLRQAETELPGRVKAFLTFDSALAHRIEAGADAFLMPSRYEPCGLNQMMSQRYGTVPVVRATGGLADTVEEYSPAGLRAGTSTGFCFRNPDPAELLAAIARAIRVYSDAPAWQTLMRNGMTRDWSWERSAREYLELYEELVSTEGDRKA
jgi:starch synthase